ncbi:MAG: NUDIX hydrolase [Candidatus Thorarchaeota archaeon]
MEKYGAPRTLSFSAEFQEFECELIRRSLAKDRNNDVTCFIRREDGKFVVIQKHQYARSGIYRAPSGGARMGESIEEAAHREMREETGLEIELLRFLLDLSLEVKCGEEILQWRSLVFLARPTGGEMRPIDTREIFDVQAMTREALLGPVDRLMRESGWGGFVYRSFLTREFFKRLDELNI